MLKLIGFILNILLIIVILIRMPKENVGLSSFATKNYISGSPSFVEKILNLLTIFGIIVYFGIAFILRFNFSRLRE